MEPSSRSRLARFQGKVFGIGLPKTATTSLEEAFEYFGYSKQGFSRDGLGLYLKSGFCDPLRELVDQYDAFADWPWCLCYKDLFREYGSNARFVLTLRKNPETWLNSVLTSSLHANMTSVRQQVYGFEMPQGHEAFLLAHYDRHIARVREFFDDNGASHQLLEIIIGEDGSWKKLCDFLDVKADQRGFSRKNATQEREFNHRTLYSNLNVLNNAQVGLDRPMMTFPEASQATPVPQWRDPRTFAHFRDYADVGLELAKLRKARGKTPASRPHRSKIRISNFFSTGTYSRDKQTGFLLFADEVNLINGYVRRCMSEIEHKKLYGLAVPSKMPGKTGYEELGSEVALNLTQAVAKFVDKKGVLPNLLFPQTFSEFNILAKAFTRFPNGPLEDKIEAASLVPESVRHLLHDHVRPFVSDRPVVPDNEQISAGHYLWKANFGYALYDMIEFPVTEEKRAEMKAHAVEWFNSPSNEATGQWWTRYVKRKVYLESRIGELGQDPKDWKFFVFGGRVGMLQVDFGRHSDHHQSAYDRDFKRLNMDIFAPRGEDVEKPERYEDMVAIAEAIGEAFDFMRVDLYYEDGKIYLGELSAVPNAGFKPFRSQALDFKLGALWPKDSVLRQDLDWYYETCNTGSQQGLPS